MNKTIRIAVAMLFFVIGAGLAYPSTASKGGLLLNLPVFATGLFTFLAGIVLLFFPRLGCVLGSLALLCCAATLVPRVAEAGNGRARICQLAWIAGLLGAAGWLLSLSNKKQS
jgi:hypothetical protein